MKLNDYNPPAGNLHSMPKMLGGALILGLLLGTACFIPPPYADELDASPNYPPVIKSATPSMPGPVTLASAGDNGPYTLVIEDKDVDDTLYIRVFRNYPQELVNFGTHPILPAEQPTVSRTYELNTTDLWCRDTSSGSTVYFDVVVADRPFDDSSSAEPVLRVIQAGGELSIRAWFGKCL